MTDIGDFPNPPMKQERYLAIWDVRARHISKNNTGLTKEMGMLIFTRRVGEMLMIGDDAEVVITGIKEIQCKYLV